MTNWKAIVFGLVLTAMVPLASAACWGIQYMPTGTWTYSAWLCNSSQVVGYWVNMYGQSGPFSMMLHGQIETITPMGLPNAGTGWRVYLQSFTYSSPYPAVLKCYKRMGIPGNYWWMYTGLQVTLNGSQYTGSSSSWNLYGCPPVRNGGQQGGSPPQVNIAIAWGGFGTMMKGGSPQIQNAVLPPAKKAGRR